MAIMWMIIYDNHAWTSYVMPIYDHHMGADGIRERRKQCSNWICPWPPPAGNHPPTGGLVEFVWPPQPTTHPPTARAGKHAADSKDTTTKQRVQCNNCSRKNVNCNCICGVDT